MATSADTPHAKAVLAFRRRLNAFFGDPRAIAYAAALTKGAAAPTTTEKVLDLRLEDVLTRLGFGPTNGTLRLRKSLTMHDGRVVAMVGDGTPLAAEEHVRIVTTTTTVLDGEQMRVETNVLVFGPGGIL
jgi:hypothetical protein